ncbi:MAG: hypothetical protein FWB94_00430, partial [Chitinispirillia bacterium]|nr:hypothetical protein [Chitinispirillia bacterium]
LSQYETGARQPSKRVLDKVRRLLIERGFAKEPCSLIEEKLLEEFRQLVSTDQEWISGIVTRLAQTPKRRAKPR